MKERTIRFWCQSCVDRSLMGWWIKNETPAKCDGAEGVVVNGVVVVPPPKCERQAEWVLVRE